MVDAPKEFLPGVSKAWWSGDGLGVDLFGMEIGSVHGNGSNVLSDVIGA